MQLGTFAHPWDLRELAERGDLEWLVSLGYSAVAVATAYHAGRWLTPWSRDGMVRFLEDGTVHFPPRGDYGALRPEPSAEARSEPGLADLVGRARDAGLSVSGWTVAFHNTRLGSAQPHECVHNAFGDRYTYALCPARDEVRRYGLALLADVVTLGVDAVELEALGWMGHRHGSHHDKSSFSTDAVTDFLLSYCFCDRCAAGLKARDADPDAVAELVRLLVRRRLTEGDAMAPPATPADVHGELADLLGESELTAMLAHRRAVLEDLLHAARAAVPPDTRLIAHVRPDPLYTGSSMGLPLEIAAQAVDEVVLTHYGEDPGRVAAAYRDVTALPCRAHLSFHPKAPEFRTDPDLTRMRDIARGLGLAGLRVYHLGLLPRRTIERAALALRSNS